MSAWIVIPLILLPLLPMAICSRRVAVEPGQGRRPGGTRWSPERASSRPTAIDRMNPRPRRADVTGLLIMDRTGKIVGADVRAAEMFGYAPAELETLELADLYPALGR